nr:ABC transporter permease [Desulfobacula sp.]
MQRFSSTPCGMYASFWRNRSLVRTLVRREVTGRYQGSILGIIWSFVNPLFMLAVYTFVFSVVLKARWNVGNDSKTEFALVLFAGLIIFNLFADCLNRAPSLILANANYVKKVIFPLEILPLVVMGSALFHALISLSVWLVFYFIFFGVPPASALLFPVLIMPVILLTMGFSWILASLGVFLRDISQVTGLVTTVLMFLSPIFYPLSALPVEYRSVLFLNPLTFALEQLRNALIWGKIPDLLEFSVYLAVSALVAWLGFAWFQKTRKGFADVL